MILIVVVAVDGVAVVAVLVMVAVVVVVAIAVVDVGFIMAAAEKGRIVHHLHGDAHPDTTALHRNLRTDEVRAV